MAAVHFATIPCKPCTAHNVQGSHIFSNISPSANDISYALGLWMLEVFCTIYEGCMLKFSCVKNYG